MRSIVLISVAVLLTAPSLGAQDIANDSTIRAIIKRRVDARLSTGIVVGVFGASGRRRVVSYGASGTARPLDANSVFEIGSITKTFTALVLADMVARGEIRYDDPVAKLLPATVRVPTRKGHQITLLDLATQSSGLPYMPSNLRPKDAANPFADYTTDLMYEFLLSYKLTRDIGSQYEYSNYGVGLLGHALALRAGLDLETLYRRRILDSLRMPDTRIALTQSMRERLALGHGAKGEVVTNWDFGALGGAGALRSTATDMLTYLAANLVADVDSTRGPLAPAMHATHIRRREAGSTQMGIGLAWHLATRPDGGTIVWHNGGTGGYRTFSGYDAGRRTGVVVLTNSNISADDIGFHLLSPAIPLRPPQLPSIVMRKEISLPGAILDRYVGEYELARSFHIVVTRGADGLIIEPTGQGRVPIFAESETEFFLKLVDALISFDVDSTGKATALTLHQNGQHIKGTRIK
jgi:CubicO group peptidase (beta-lactamase class C family)